MPVRLINRTAQRLAHGVARSVDTVFASTALSPGAATRKGSSAESFGHEARMEGLALIERFYTALASGEGAAALASGEIGAPFFGRPPSIDPRIKRVRRSFGRDGEVLDLSWDSDFEPLWSPEVFAAALRGVDVEQELQRLPIDRSGSLREKYMAVEPNLVGHARWFRHTQGAPRPCVVLLHGYLGGNYLLEERMWPVRRFFDGGLDVVLTVLPFHGPRRDPRRGLMPPSFPSSDPRFTIEGMRHLVHDHRALFDFLRDGRVASLGVMGMSLGGYSAGLLSTVEELEFAVLQVPLAAIDRFAHEHGRMIGEPEQQQAQAEAMRRAHVVISPLSRPPLVPGGRTIVLAGEADRVTGLEHSRMLAEHFGGEHVTFGGGHLLQVGRGRAFEPVWTMLEQAGVYSA